MEPLSTDDPAEIGGFRLRARLGAGGMGRVYLASTPGGRRVALKVVRPELGDDADFRARFRQEIEAAQRVRGVYTAELLSADPAATPPWLVTAYVPGPSLQQAVADQGPMPAETVILLMAGIAEALQAIHAASVVHRDLKPSNVLLAPDGPRVIDFGIARAAEAISLTQSGVAVGSPQFMAPEQIRGQAITPAVDVFSLGAVAAFALLGRPPFGEGQVAALMYRVLNEPPGLAGCRGPLRTLIERCLAKDPAARPAPAQIIESCRVLSSGNLGDLTDSWLPPAVAAAAARAPAIAGMAGAPSGPSPRPGNGPGQPGNGAGTNGITQAPGPPPRGAARPPAAGAGNAASGRGTPPAGAPPGDSATGRQRQPGPTSPASPAGPGPYPPAGPGPYPPAGPPFWRPPVPSSLTAAANLMYAGGAVSAAAAIAGLATIPPLRVIAAQMHPASPQGAVGAAVAVLLVHGVLGTALWLWLARETRRGLRRARAWATALFVLATVTGVGVDAHTPATGLTQAFSGIGWLIGLCAVILLWNRPSRAYYNALHPVSRPPSGPQPVAPSPSLRPRQAAPGTQRDWPARPQGAGPPDAPRSPQPGQRR